MLKRLKQALLGLASAAGVTALVARSGWRRRRLLVLCYHGVSIDDEHEWNPSLFVSREVLRERLTILKSGGYAVLGLGEAVKLMREGRLPPGAVTLTFDDGNHDFYASAWPLLKEFGLPATVYLTTYYCRDQRAVFDMVVSYVLWKGRDRRLDGAAFAGEARTFGLGSSGERREAYDRILEHAAKAGLDAAQKDELVQRLAAHLGVDYERIRAQRIVYLMTPDEVKAVATAGVEIELHSHRHRTPADEDLFRREIRENRQAIAEITGTGAASHFCYPSGVTDSHFLPWLRAEGVQSATTLEVSFATRDRDPLMLPRIIDCMTLSRGEFEGWLAGVSAFLPRRKY